MMHAVVAQGAATASFARVSNGAAPRLTTSSGPRWRWQARGSVRSGTVERRGLGIRAKVISVTEKEFEAEVLNSELPVLVDFWASWCGPCKLVATSMVAVDRKYEGKLKVVKVETDPNPKLVEAYKVYGLPTLIMFRDGEVVSGGRYEGAISLAKLESMLKKALPSLAAA